MTELTNESTAPGITDPEIAGIMGWRGPGAYTEATLRKIRRVLEEDRSRRATPSSDCASMGPLPPASAIPDGAAVGRDGTVYHGIAEIWHRMEEAHALHQVLDDKKVPRADADGLVYSLVGRVEHANAARRATPSSECALPPLPEEAARAMKGDVAFFVKWSDSGKELRGPILLFTAEQVEQIRREAVEADREHQKARIMHLTHERDKARADLSAQLARQSQGDEAEIYAIWDAAKAEAAMYIEAHCVDGEIHARHIMGAARPKVTAAPPLSSEPQARPRPYYGQDFLNWNRQQPDPPVKIGRELAVAQAAFDLMTKGDAHD